MHIELYTKGMTLPPLLEGSMLQSAEMFHLLEENTKSSPVMIVAYKGNEEMAHMLAVKYRELRLLPPGFYFWYTLHGEGTYRDDATNREELFAMMLDKLFTLFDIRHTFIEVRNLKDSSFAYDVLSKREFFPIRDMRIYNSLHDIHPSKRLTRAYRSHIRKAEERGVTFHRATSPDEIETALHLLRNYYKSKIRRHLPPAQFLRNLLIQPDGRISDKAKLFVVQHKGKTIGCSLCIHEKERAYLAYSCGLRKSHHLLYPGIMAVWAAITDAYNQGVPHFEFLEPKEALSTRLGYIDFILNFGGKQVGTLRWYHFKWNGINKILRAIYV